MTYSQLAKRLQLQARCQRCFDLLSGRYDALSGRFLLPEDPIDRMVAEGPLA